jgi:ribosomal protein S18 acetylase RimI-like enzyme
MNDRLYASSAAVAEEIQYRPATVLDASAMASLHIQNCRASEDWELRAALYLSGEHLPRLALGPHIVILAIEDDEVVGFIAGHLSRRFHCDGELQWLQVSTAQRDQGIASELLRQLADWFLDHNAHRICVDVKPNNTAVRSLYTDHGAEPLENHKHWLVWPDIASAFN